jgi:hypothetical protein
MRRADWMIWSSRLEPSRMPSAHLNTLRQGSGFRGQIAEPRARIPQPGSLDSRQGTQGSEERDRVAEPGERDPDVG